MNDTDALLAALPADGGSIGNKMLRETLGWDANRYEAVHAQLLAAGLIIKGRGRGGSVKLAINGAEPSAKPKASSKPKPASVKAASPPIKKSQRRMALKKSELYSFLWASCDELRGGMDASQYKDYVLTLLFLKYVSDKYAGQPFGAIQVPAGASFADLVQLKGRPDIGDQINKTILAPLAAANKLADFPDFNDAGKLGSGKELVDRLTNLIAIFQDPSLDFSRNRADGDDILGDAYEYLMRHFATESGKSKGQFYTPAEVSRIIAAILRIREADTGASTTVNDPYECFAGFGVPPGKQGDYAYLLHIVRSLKATGRAACILPHGVLFRGNAEAEIRRNLLRRGYLRAIIGLPPNLFYGTGIPACILLIDKRAAAPEAPVFMVDASAGFAKDGPKNRLRARDIHLIVDLVTRGHELPGTSRLVPYAEIAGNDHNLNLPRYIDSQQAEDLQDIDAHLHGGIPERDLDALQAYWQVCPALRDTLFGPCRPGYRALRVAPEAIRVTITGYHEFAAFVAQAEAHFQTWCQRWANESGSAAADSQRSSSRAALPRAAEPRLAYRAAATTLRDLAPGFQPKELIAALAEDLLDHHRERPLLDPYAVYQHLMDYWSEQMQDDAYLISAEGWRAEPYRVIETDKKGKERLPPRRHNQPPSGHGSPNLGTPSPSSAGRHRCRAGARRSQGRSRLFAGLRCHPQRSRLSRMTNHRPPTEAQTRERRAPARPEDAVAELGLGVPRKEATASADRHKLWYSRGYLPHFDAACVTHTISFRLKDSVPRHCLPALEQELADLTDDDDRKRQRRQRIESLLDAGYGCCALRDPGVASIMQETLIKWHDDRYDLWAWCIMPNHVHVLITARAPLGTIVQSWKSFVARWARSRASEQGLTVPDDGFWMREYWDRYIRNEQHFAAARHYIEHNPVAAGLCRQAADWRWSSAYRSVALAGDVASQSHTSGADAELGLGGPRGADA